MVDSCPAPILDLYVGSLAEMGPLREVPGVSWQCLSAAAPTALRRCTEGAFATSDDFEKKAYERIVDGFFRHRESLREHSWLAWSEQGAAGACLVSDRFYYSPEQSYPYVELVAVDPRHRGLGLGHALLEKALLSLAEAGHRSVVHAHIRRGNTASEKLFLARGFLRWRED